MFEILNYKEDDLGNLASKYTWNVRYQISNQYIIERKAYTDNKLVFELTPYILIICCLLFNKLYFDTVPGIILITELIIQLLCIFAAIYIRLANQIMFIGKTRDYIYCKVPKLNRYGLITYNKYVFDFKDFNTSYEPLRSNFIEPYYFKLDRNPYWNKHNIDLYLMVYGFTNYSNIKIQ